MAATVDHKQPQSKHGDKFDYKNLAVCCWDCNNEKGNKSWNEWQSSFKI
jgi:5-methylcytosine-specific restriction endonuclease McrA